MSERYTRLFSLPGSLYTPKAPPAHHGRSPSERQCHRAGAGPGEIQKPANQAHQGPDGLPPGPGHPGPAPGRAGGAPVPGPERSPGQRVRPERTHPLPRRQHPGLFRPGAAGDLFGQQHLGSRGPALGEPAGTTDFGTGPGGHRALQGIPLPLPRCRLFPP